MRTNWVQRAAAAPSDRADDPYVVGDHGSDGYAVGAQQTGELAGKFVCQLRRPEPFACEIEQLRGDPVRRESTATGWSQAGQVVRYGQCGDLVGELHAQRGACLGQGPEDALADEARVLHRVEHRRGVQRVADHLYRVLAGDAGARFASPVALTPVGIHVQAVRFLPPLVSLSGAC
ncbi:hypothetical protein [Streptomyces sp. NPDC094049]|uniref:hypothetical protein n=1 Tax=Streptomyces sp. NPDC094049 TaxID=3154987 RepID=UPI00331D5A46